MNTLTITAKGQVTLKQSLLSHLGVGPGSKVEVDELPDGAIVIRAAKPKGTIRDFIGCLSQHEDDQEPLTLSIEQMNEIITKSWADEVDEHNH